MENTPLKVAIATSFPKDPHQPCGGVEAVSVNLVLGLSKFDDLEIHVVTGDPSRIDVCFETWNGATIHRLPWSGRKVLTHAIGEGRRQLKAYLSTLQPDVVHAHDTYGLMIKGLKGPRVFTIHGFIHEDTLYSSRRLTWLRARLWRWIETAGWANQPHIVAISPYVRERLRGIARGVIHDIDNPIAEAFFHIPREERKGTIFSAAVICERKNTLGLLEAFSRMIRHGVDGQLRLAGSATETDYEEQVRTFIDTNGLEGNVTLLGKIGTDRVREELAQASCFALVSFEEGAPMGLAEAMAAAVPVVTSNRCGMPYMVRNGETGFLIDPNDPEQIASRLAEVLQNDTLRAEMGQRSHQVALDRFHPDRVAARTRQVYLQAVRDDAGRESHATA